MPSPGPAHFVNRWTQAATVITVCAGLVVPAGMLELPQLVLWSSSAVYLGLLTGGIYFAERAAQRWLLAAYFFVATALLFTLLLKTHGWVWLIGLPLLSHVVLFASWRWAVVWSVAMLGVVLAAAPAAAPWLQAGAGLGAAAAFVIAFSVIARREVEWRLRSEQLSISLAAANQQLRAHAAEVAELSAIRERNRVAREVHDGLGHYLTTIHVQLEAARALLERDPQRARQGVERAQLLAKEGLQDVRESVSLLRHTTTEPEPLEEALAELVRGDTESGAVPSVNLEVEGVRRRVSDTLRHALRRVLQEALTNVNRHSNATRVDVRLCFEPQQVVLDVEDDGTQGAARCRNSDAAAGSDPLRGAGHGLLGISERVHLLGGKAWFGATPSGGFRVKVTVPA